MTTQQSDRLLGLAVRPVELQYFIFYCSPYKPGLHVVNTWSCEATECVQANFLSDYSEECPVVLFVVCPGAN